MKLVLDTNVLYAGLRSQYGASFKLLEALRHGRIEVCVTAPLMFEYDDVLHRPTSLPHLTPADVDDFLDWFALISSHHNVYYLWRPYLPDPKDDMVLEAAMSSSADALVTFNAKDFKLAPGVGVRVMTPNQILMSLPP